MFPLRDENPHFLTPLVTYAVIAANVAVWVTVQGLGAPEPLARSICDYGLISGELLGTATTCIGQVVPAQRQPGKHMVRQVSGDLGHAAGVARGAGPSALAAEGEKVLMAAVLATDPGKAVSEDATLQIGPEVPFHPGWD